MQRATTKRKKVEYVAERYSEGKITLERATSDAGTSVREMMDYLKQKKVPSQYDVEELEKDMKKFYMKKK